MKDVAIIKSWFIQKNGAISLSHNKEFIIEKETEKAVLIKQKNRESWMPKSAVEFLSKAEIEEYIEKIYSQMQDKYSAKEIQKLAQKAIGKSSKVNKFFIGNISKEEEINYLSFQIIEKEL